ncbi:MAG: VCBS repeat-containing protein [Deltaproteobacteria bacterium]|nr:VCBS repeat-containing protein [Deltaproteobacteria bacterium]
MRVVDLADAVDANIVLEVADGTNRWFVSFGSNAVGGTLMSFSGAGSATLPPLQTGRTDYFLIEIAGDGTTADVFVDGVEVASDWSGIVSPLQRVNFGDGQTSSVGRGRYPYVRFAIGPQACRDGIDNDGDGLVDFAGGDGGCSQANDPSEDDVDRDGDGLADLVEIAARTDLGDVDSDGDGLTDAAEQGRGTFGAPRVVTTLADFVEAVFASDLDGDGDMDVLSASVANDEIAWYANTDGLGSFGPKQTISTLADGPQTLISADVDGDGDFDVLSASATDDEIAWYENTNGAGSFGPQRIISTLADFPFAIATADVDGDGDVDVLSASRLDDEIAWYENTDGAGSFGPQQIISTLADSARSVFAADVDGDGDVDVLSASLIDDEIAWYANTDGAGSFGPQQIITTLADAARSVSAADLDGDGDVDVLSASENDDEIAWYANTDGLGSFGPQQIITTLADRAQSVVAVDMDGDGDLDVLSSSVATGPIAWYENTDGAGSFGPQRAIAMPAFDVAPAIASDLDGDGDVDVLSASSWTDEVAWYENRNLADPLDADSDEDGLLDAAEVNTHATDPRDPDSDDDGLSDGAEVNTHDTDPLDPDSDDDGLSDAAEVNVHATDPLAVDSDGDGLLDNFEVANGFAPTLRDENANGKVDGADDADADGLGNAFEQAVGTAVNDPDSDDDGLLDGEEIASGVFGPQQLISTLADQAVAVSTGDLDGDGDLDVLTASLVDDEVAWHANTNGLGSFGPQRIITTLADGAASVIATDVDGDGDADALSASRDDDRIAWYENPNGLGSFGPQQTITTLADGATSVFAADVDGDGDVDVLSASESDDEIAWYANTDGLGSFGPQQIITTLADGATSVFAVDVDGDGDVDVLSASALDDEIAWYANTDGSGSFGPQQIITTLADSARSVFAADVDGDGDVDVLSASALDDEIAWYENTDGLGSFGPQQIITTLAIAATSVFASDVDGDGDVDVLSASAGTTRSPGMRTRTDQGASVRSRSSRRWLTTPSRCSLPTWMGTGTSTCSLRRRGTTRSPGTRTATSPIHSTRTATTTDVSTATKSPSAAIRSTRGASKS